MNHLMESHRAKEQANRLLELTEAVSKLSIDAIGKNVNDLRKSMEENSAAIKEFSIVVNFKDILISYRSPISECSYFLKGIKKYLFYAIAILSIISCEGLWLCLKR